MPKNEETQTVEVKKLSLQRSDLIAYYAEKNDLSKKEAERRIVSMFGGLEDVILTLAENEPDEKGIRGSLTLKGFGTYVVKDTEVCVPGDTDGSTKKVKTFVRFRAGKQLKDIINQ